MPKTPRVPRVLLLIETSRVYGRRLALGIGRYVAEHGPWSIDFERSGLYDRFPPWVKNWRGDGIISRTERRSDVDKLLATGLPVVELFADPDLGLPCVWPKMDRTGELAAEHLLGLGLDSFAFFATERHWWVEARRDGFARVLGEHGYPCSRYGQRSRRGGKGRGADDQRILDWIASLSKPCGVFCPSDRHAVQLLNVCRVYNIPVPEQLAVLGTDNDPVISSLTFPPLSSIDSNSQRVGYEAAALLERLMAGEQPQQQQKAIWVEPGQVVARQSTDVLAIDDPEVAQAVRFIREHACRGITIGDVAEVVGVSHRGLQRRFLKFLHRTPKDEIMHVQMERARLWLRQTDMTVEMISKKSGFASPKYFARIFRQATGMTPSAFRNEHRIYREETFNRG